MNQKSSEKGMIIIAIVFILCIVIGLSAIISLFQMEVPLVVSRLKRFQALNYAEAALYEAFNRFRTGYPDPASGNLWDPVAWANGTSIPTDATVVFPAGVSVDIEVQWDDMNTPLDLTDDRIEVAATVDQDDIIL